MLRASSRGLPSLEAALNREVERLQKEAVGERELEKAKNQLEAEFIYAQDSLFYQAMLLAQNESAKDWRIADDYVPSVRKVTAQDIMRTAKKYLVPDNRTVGVLVPLPTDKSKSAPETPLGNQRIIR